METGDAARKRITELRTEGGVSEYRLARETLLVPSTVKSMLQSKSRAPQTDTVAVICASLGITVREFYNSPLFEDPDTAGEDALEGE